LSELPISAEEMREQADAELGIAVGRSRLRGAWLRGLAFLIAGFVLTLLADPAVVVIARKIELNGRSLWLLDTFSDLTTFRTVVGVALLFFLLDFKHRRFVLRYCASPFVAILIVEILKIVVGRSRPFHAEAHMGWFESLFQGFAYRHQSFPSGHAAGAFALAFVLSQRFPRVKWIWIALAVGICIDRLVEDKHYLSDVYVGGFIGLGCAWFVARLIPDRARNSVPDVERAPPPAKLDMHRDLRPWTALALLVILVAASLGTYFIGNGQISFWDRDESRYAEATREMLSTGDYIVPRFNRDLRLAKPILIYWLVAIAYKVFGEGEFAARFWPGIFACATCLLTALLATKMYGRRAGVFSAFVLATSALFVVEAKLTSPDVLLCFFVMASIVCLYEVAGGNGRWPAAMGFWVALALATLTKGPVGLLMVFTTGIAYAAMTRSIAFVRHLKPVPGILVFLAIVLPWVVAAQGGTDGELLRVGLGYNVLDRAIRPLEGHSGFAAFYPITAIGALFPWFFFLIPALIWTWRRGHRDRAGIFLLCWIAAPLVMMEYIQTKMVHYMMPVYPAVAILVGGLFARLSSGDREQPSMRAAWLVKGSTLVLWLLLGVGIPVLLWQRDMSRFVPEVLWFSVPAVVAGAVSFVLLQRRRFTAAFISLAAGAFVLWAALAGGTLARLDWIRPSKPLAQSALGAAAEERSRVALWGYEEPSLIYYLGGPVTILDDLDEAEKWLATEGNVAVVDSKRLELLRQRLKDSLRVIVTHRGFKVAKGRWVDISIVAGTSPAGT